MYTEQRIQCILQCILRKVTFVFQTLMAKVNTSNMQVNATCIVVYSCLNHSLFKIKEEDKLFRECFEELFLPQ